MNSISVIIPAYNRANLLPITLRSLLAQSRPADEIIVVDDGSTDNTAAVAKVFGSPVQVIRQANRGPAAARNRGFAESSGRYVLFFDSDDLLAYGSLQAACSLLEQSGADVTIGRRIRARINGSHVISVGSVVQQKGLPRGYDLIQWLLTHWSIMPHQMLFRRTIIEKARGFTEDLWVAEDQEFFLRCLLAGASASWCPGFLLLYRDGSADKLSESSAPRKIGDWAKFLLRARDLCLAAGAVDPLRWFGYRFRLWRVLEDLRQANCCLDIQGLLIRALAEKAEVNPLYRIADRCRKLSGGLRQRLCGHRDHPCFRSGMPTPAQMCELKNAFFLEKKIS